MYRFKDWLWLVAGSNQSVPLLFLPHPQRFGELEVEISLAAMTECPVC